MMLSFVERVSSHRERWSTALLRDEGGRWLGLVAATKKESRESHSARISPRLAAST
jgi:hypothetical protein